MSKLFIIGLPRTGTTSLCSTLLEFGLKVAHTAYTQDTFYQADVVADTPVYCDYPDLDLVFPGSRFIYLDRDPETWVPSIQSLLGKIDETQNRARGTQNPILSRCLNQVFGSLTEETLNDYGYLSDCFLHHRKLVNSYFATREAQLLRLNLEKESSTKALSNFIQPQNHHHCQTFPTLNANGKINDWNKIKHPNKISSNTRGTNRARYFNF